MYVDCSVNQRSRFNEIAVIGVRSWDRKLGALNLTPPGKLSPDLPFWILDAEQKYRGGIKTQRAANTCT